MTKNKNPTGSSDEQVRTLLETLLHMRDMTKDAEHELHAILLSCKRARKQILAAFPAQKSSVHLSINSWRFWRMEARGVSMCPPPTVKLEARVKPRQSCIGKQFRALQSIAGTIKVTRWLAVQLPIFLQIQSSSKSKLQSCLGGQWAVAIILTNNQNSILPWWAVGVHV